MIDDGGAVFGRAETSDVTVAHVIHVDEDDVGFAGGGSGDEEGQDEKNFHSVLKVAKSLWGIWSFEENFGKREVSAKLG